MTRRTRFVVAFYEVGRAYGGPEEGGWWYDTDELRRPLKIAHFQGEADELADRANRLLAHLLRHQRSADSVAYAGGQYEAYVFEDAAPRSFP